MSRLLHWLNERSTIHTYSCHSHHDFVIPTITTINVTFLDPRPLQNPQYYIFKTKGKKYKNKNKNNIQSMFPTQTHSLRVQKP